VSVECRSSLAEGHARLLCVCVHASVYTSLGIYHVCPMCFCVYVCDCVCLCVCVCVCKCVNVSIKCLSKLTGEHLISECMSVWRALAGKLTLEWSAAQCFPHDEALPYVSYSCK
jgi:hypothetical protein